MGLFGCLFGKGHKSIPRLLCEEAMEIKRQGRVVAIYELVKELPNFPAVVGQQYSNFGCGARDYNHYPLPYTGTDAVTYFTWCRRPVPTKIIENNPEYFKKIK